MPDPGLEGKPALPPWDVLEGTAPDEPAKIGDVLRRELHYLHYHRHADKSREVVARNLIGLSLSGGGIRSATTSLGILQALSTMEILPLVDYVCTVSGGGYIGSCLSSLLSLNAKWLPSAPEPAKRPKHPNDPYTYRGGERPAFTTEPRRFPFRAERRDPAGRLATDLVAHLRTHGNFLVAHRGLLRRDAMRAIGNLLTGIVYNLLGFLVTLYAVSAAYLAATMLLAPATPAVLGRPETTRVEPDTTKPVRIAGDTARVRIGSEPCEPPEPGCGVETRTTLRPPSLWARAKYDVGMLGALFVNAWHDRTVPGPTPLRPGRTSGLPDVLVVVATALVVGAVASVTVFVWIWLALANYRGGGQGGAGAPRPGESQEERFDRGVLRQLALFLSAAVVLTTVLLRWVSFPALAGYQQLVWLAVPFAVLLGARVVSFVVAMVLPQFLGRLWSRRLRSLWGGYQAVNIYGLWTLAAFALLAPVAYALRDYQWSVGVGGVSSLVVARLLTPRVRPRGGRMKLTASVLHALLAVAVVLVVTLGVLFFAALLVARYETPTGFLVAAAVGAALLLGLGWVVDHNKLSPHYFYRDRLAETYLLSEIPDEQRRLWVLRDAMEMPLSCVHGDPERGTSPGEWRNSAPYHLISAAINLAGSRDLTRKDRKSGYWLFSKLFCGSVHTGFRPTAKYRSGKTKLARAVAISGAAASSGVGFASFFAQAFAAVLFNVRLGYWLENPAHARSLKRAEGVVFWPKYLFKEVTMATTEHDALVNLSDGGHTGDNVGMYPLLERRCKVVVVCDAERDSALTFGSFTEALRQAYVDLGVSVDIDLSMIRPDPVTGLSRSHCAVGRIRYPDRPDQASFLIYLKNSLTGDEPAPMLNYKASCPDFPHESTVDQFFDDAQFESYRALGVHIAEHTFGPWITGKAFEHVRDFHWHWPYD